MSDSASERPGARDDLAGLLRRRALTEDAARPDRVARRRAAGGRTARENVTDLIDPGSWVEYGRLAIAAQRQRRDLRDLVVSTPADGLLAGTARVDGHPCAVLSYDYTVLAGTQGMIGHRKKDRLFELIERMRLPVFFFAEGGGGRPGDTDFPGVSWLETRAFALWARLSGRVPRIAIVKGRCFAGNAVIAGCSDLVIATRDTSIGMGGPAMIAGGGLGEVDPDAVGPVSMQEPNGVLDVVVADEAEAVAVAKRLMGYFTGPVGPGTAGDQAGLRGMVSRRERRAHKGIPVIAGPAPAGPVTRPPEGFPPGGVLHEPLLTVAGPSAHLGPMGLEGAVRLGLRKELETIEDEAERERRVREVTAAAEENAKAVNAAQLFELDDVVDPAETRGLI